MLIACESVLTYTVCYSAYRICLDAAMFADDLLLMTISVCDLQRMVNLFIEEFENMDMLFSVE